MKAKLDSTVQVLVNPQPVIAGKVRTLMSRCGKPGCKCMKKTNPEKHTYRQLSYTHKKKTQTMYVKKNDLAIIAQMTDNYKKLRQASLDLGHEAAVLTKAHGAETAGNMVMDSFDQARHKVVGVRPESLVLRKAKASHAVWKNKAMDRQVILEKKRITIRDMAKSRKNWKIKAKKAQKELKKSQKQLNDANRKIIKLEKEVSSKKNFTEQRR